VARRNAHSGRGFVSSALFVAGVAREGSQRRVHRASIEPQLQNVVRGKLALTSEITSTLVSGGVPVVQDPYVFARLAEQGKLDQRRF